MILIVIKPNQGQAKGNTIKGLELSRDYALSTDAQNKIDEIKSMLAIGQSSEAPKCWPVLGWLGLAWLRLALAWLGLPCKGMQGKARQGNTIKGLELSRDSALSTDAQNKIDEIKSMLAIGQSSEAPRCWPVLAWLGLAWLRLARKCKVMGWPHPHSI